MVAVTHLHSAVTALGQLSIRLYDSLVLWIPNGNVGYSIEPGTQSSTPLYQTTGLNNHSEVNRVESAWTTLN
jgi:hypothetical protein